MSGELTPMPLPDILAAVGYRTAIGDWPPGFDVPHAMLTLINITERLRLSLGAHHTLEAHGFAGDPCPVCVAAQGADPDDVLTDLKAPDRIPETMRGRPDDSETPGVEWCGLLPDRDFLCTRPLGHPGLHYNSDHGWC